MDNPEKIAYKVRLKEFGLSLIGERIAAARTAMDQAQESANNEGKSSAGDKYETGRAMGHLQRDMYARQLGEYSKEQAALHSVNVETVCAVAGPGALVDCGSVSMFIAAGLGKQVIDGRAVLFLSPQAPLAQLMLGRVAGSVVKLNAAEYVISEVF